jgi:hypothetical protein
MEKVEQVLELTPAELAGLFGVDSDEIDDWRATGVPAPHADKLVVVASVAELLARRLKPGVAATAIRRRAEAYDGATGLELIAGDRHDELLAAVRDSFAWSEPI